MLYAICGARKVLFSLGLPLQSVSGEVQLL